MRLIFLFAVVFWGVNSIADSIEWNGFGSVYGGQSLTSQLYPVTFSDPHPEFGKFSLFGLNLSSKISDKLNVAAQFIGGLKSSAQDVSLNINWTYVIYQPNEDWSLKIGRQIFPAFIASEYSNVMYLQPYRSMPREVSNILPYSGFDGVSAGRPFGTGIGKLSMAFFFGRPNVSISTSSSNQPENVGTYDLLGGTLTLENDGFLIRTNMSRASVNVKGIPNSGNMLGTMNMSANTLTNTIGMRLNHKNFVYWLEYGYERSEDGTELSEDSRFLEYNRGGYFLIGYEFNKWMPRYTFSQAQAKQMGSESKVITHCLGFNYQLDSQLIFKFDFQVMTIPTSNTGRVTDYTRSADGSTETQGRSIYGGLDFIF